MTSFAMIDLSLINASYERVSARSYDVQYQYSMPSQYTTQELTCMPTIPMMKPINIQFAPVNANHNNACTGE